MSYKVIRVPSPNDDDKENRERWTRHLKSDPAIINIITDDEIGEEEKIRMLQESIADQTFNADAFDNEYEASALEIASEKGYADVVEFLLDNNASVDMNQNTLTPLMRAANVKIAALLLTRGADVNAEDALDRTPVMYACMDKRYDVAELLVNSGANMEAVDEAGKSAQSYYNDMTEQRANVNFYI